MEEQLEHSIFPERPVVYATFWQRFAATFIDGLMLMVAIVILERFILGDGMFAFLVETVMCWLYDAVQESSPNMATLGKRALRIKVTALNGERLSFGKATGRHFGKYISLIILLIGYFMMLWDDRNQTLHDKMAGTLVVSAE